MKNNKGKYFYTADMIKQGEDHFFMTEKDKLFLDNMLKSLSDKISDLEVKVFYAHPEEKPEVVRAINLTGTNRISHEPGTILKAFRLSNVPEGAVKWKNKLSTFFAVDEKGAGAGTSNPAEHEGIVPPDSHPHLGNLDPTAAKKKLDSINDLYSILCNFDMDKAMDEELKDLQKYIPHAAAINRVQHNIYFYNESDEELGKIKIDMIPKK